MRIYCLPINGIAKPIFRRNLSSLNGDKEASIPTTSDSESKIRRCNERLVNAVSPINDASISLDSNTQIDVEVQKTIEVGSILGYGMKGKEREVSSIVKEKGVISVIQ